MQFRLVGANLRVKVAGNSANNLVFGSASLTDPTTSFYPAEGGATEPTGFDVPMNLLPTVRPGTRLSTNGAVAVYHTSSPEATRDWRKETYILSKNDANFQNQTCHQTAPLAIGSINPLSSAVSQVSVPIQFVAAAHYESQAPNLFLVSKTAPTAVPAHEAVESVLTSPHQTPTAIIAKSAEKHLSGLINAGTKMASDGFTNHILPKLLTKMEGGFEAAFSSLAGLL